jgi:hypothetical protein
MNMVNAAKPTLKQKAVQDLKDFALVSLYLACFFCALTTYTVLLLNEYDATSVMNYGFALINALVVAKVILIGEMAHLGERSGARPLYQVASYKAFLYCLLVLAFHFVEEFVKRLIHGDPAGTVLHEISINDLVGRSLIIFCTFVPLFAFRALRDVLGIEKFNSLFYRAGTP